ncbi:MAG: TetR/AcrR family transcriptional regulator [Polyangiaceae bacterium]
MLRSSGARAQSTDAPQPAREDPSSRAAASRARILVEAARIIRERGIAGASVDMVMGAAGLTRGGFYAHFPDKTALAAEALGLMFDRATRRWVGGAPTTASPGAWAAAAISKYLTMRHVDSPGDGCWAPALAAELSRAEPELRAVAGARTDELVNAMAARLAGDSPVGPSHRSRALLLFAACVGAVSLARAVGDRALATEIVDSVRGELLALFGERP